MSYPYTITIGSCLSMFKIEETKDVLKRIMNPASHAALVSLYESELKNAIAGVQKLKENLNDEGENHD